MDRRSLFKGLAAFAVLPVVGVATSGSANAIVGEIAPEVRFRMTAKSGPTGYSRSAWEVKTLSGEWRGANMYIDVPDDPSLPIRHVI